MKDRKKPEKFLPPHGMPSDGCEFAFSSRVPPKALTIKIPYTSWNYQNMYAKATTGLQRLLRVYWVVHNFLRVHFTTREVPAVALGLLERRLSVQEIFQI